MLGKVAAEAQWLATAMADALKSLEQHVATAAADANEHASYAATL
mgnify:CR=1 FL=1